MKCSAVNVHRCGALLIAALLLFLLTTPVPGQSADSLASRRPVPDFNVMLNDDGDWSFVSMDPDESRRYILAAMDAMAGTPVKTYIRCIGAGSDTLYYPTKVGSVLGWRQETGNLTEYIEKVRAGMAAGVDPIRLSGRRCHEIGIRFFPSIRMNDAHFARTAPTHPLTGEFWVKNHDRLTMDHPENWLDFTYPEVRAYRMGIVTEVIERYQDVMDGVELDFTRHPLYFPHAAGMKYADLLTEMVAQTRALLDEASAGQGRPMYLIVRINATLQATNYTGLDVERWAREGYIDVMVPSLLYDLSNDMDITSLKSLCAETGVRLYASLYPRVANIHPFVRSPREADYTGITTWIPPIEQFRGAIANLRHMGAEGFESFNFRTPPGPLGFEVLCATSQPAALVMQDRLYAITTGKPKATNSPAEQLPTQLQPCQPLTLQLYVGQDFKDPDEPHPAYVGLRLGLAGFQDTPHLQVTINGHTLHKAEDPLPLTPVTAPAPQTMVWGPPAPDAYVQFELQDLSWLHPGRNEIQLRWDAEPSAGEIKLHQVHLGVMYDNPFNQRL